MKKFALSVLLTLIPCLSVLSQTYDEWCERAVVATEEDSLELAEKCIRQALQLEPANPRNALLFSNLGTIQRSRHRYEQALESYRMALNMAPMSVPILMNHATLSLELGQNDKARADYSQVIEIEPHNVEALLMRAYIYMQQRDYKFARLDYDTLLKIDPQHYNVRLGLAALYQREIRYDEALVVLDGMLADKGGTTPYTTDELAAVRVARAGVELDMLKPDQALLDLDEAIRLDPRQSEAYLMRGRVHLMLKKKALAKRDLEKAVSLGIPQSEVRELMNQCK
ncbi:tetratricopeptide repeat protein [uncultured Bacteroides sp.]|uniref:tetratricopeptide repeat protein n=1 Tax=uncultured Bacteroides sp. TaxID=162156 RepID=UPI00260B35DC|nr:tetratricopeptide repeat protein [uncultured Bacteroides sp.]